MARTVVTVSKGVPRRSLTGHPRDVSSQVLRPAAQEPLCEEAPSDLPKQLQASCWGQLPYLSHLELTARVHLCLEETCHRVPGDRKRDEQIWGLSCMQWAGEVLS